MQRRQTRPVRVRDLVIGGGSPVVVQSMTNTDPHQAEETLAQIGQLAAEGCEVVRVAVPDEEAVETLRTVVRRSPVPVVADIHFDYRLALGAIEAGVDKVRVNPGNIGGADRVRAVARAAAARRIPVRVGVNAGSLSPRLREKYGGATPEALVESAAEEVALLLEAGLEDIVLSLKASDVVTTIESYRQAADRFPYPLHLGVTEAGPPGRGSVRSAVGIGTLLAEGIGDTIRVSLTGDPVAEVGVAYEILKALGLRERGPVIISCPTCGRCRIDLPSLVAAVEEAVKGMTEPVRIAVMGCAVNGPGEAREADFGIAGGREEGLLFRRGEVVRKVPADSLVEVLLAELAEWRKSRSGSAPDREPGSRQEE
ncbi:MAG: flavodoxin-dependent (E)-4-hydroxy-3-methylbut-2-enyl-diphosphate synthase [Bacillota bacterium]|nr:flavodoxin-dependent (E)-4-hydroxy-3-methylbut-2-enyl-diphosphate synthase [Bacillota bacterium]